MLGANIGVARGRDAYALISERYIWYISWLVYDNCDSMLTINQ